MAFTRSSSSTFHRWPGLHPQPNTPTADSSFAMVEIVDNDAGRLHGRGRRGAGLRGRPEPRMWPPLCCSASRRSARLSWTRSTGWAMATAATTSATCSPGSIAAGEVRRAAVARRRTPVPLPPPCSAPPRPEAGERPGVRDGAIPGAGGAHRPAAFAIGRGSRRIRPRHPARGHDGLVVYRRGFGGTGRS